MAATAFGALASSRTLLGLALPSSLERERTASLTRTRTVGLHRRRGPARRGGNRGVAGVVAVRASICGIDLGTTNSAVAVVIEVGPKP
jgi:hypothetical protein